MMATSSDYLLDQFDRIADAPDAIPALRRFILDLAMRGKLVEQDSRDEPASQLLYGIVISPDPTGIGDEERTLKVPNGWISMRFGEVYSLEYGDNLPAEKRSLPCNARGAGRARRPRPAFFAQHHMARPIALCRR